MSVTVDIPLALGLKPSKRGAVPIGGSLMDKREANARYYAAHNDRIILRESELRPSTVLELIECLGELDRHPHDKRLERLERLFVDLTGTEPPHSSASGERGNEVSI